MKYYFIVNPGSRTGHGIELWEQLEERVKAEGIDYEVYFTEKEGDATVLADRICTEHPEMKRIVIAGGDGTANEAVNGLHDYNSFILGYLPTGSSNDLARGLKISQDPATAFERAIRPKLFKDVDHGIVKYSDEEGNTGSRKFAVSSGIGYDADVSHQAMVSPLKKFLNRIHLGKLIYYILGSKLIFTDKRAKCDILIDGKDKLHCDRLLFAAAMNTVYEGGGMPMGPHANPSDGKVTVCVVHDISRIKHLGLMLAILKGKHINYRGVEEITCKSFEITTDIPMAIHTDGEYVGDYTHAVFSCVPEKVKMML